MAKLVTFDELIVTIRVPADLPDSIAAALARTLKSKSFRARLRRKIRDAFLADPSLSEVRLRLSR
jgi:hypothetical protein